MMKSIEIEENNCLKKIVVVEEIHIGKVEDII